MDVCSSKYAVKMNNAYFCNILMYALNLIVIDSEYVINIFDWHKLIAITLADCFV